MIAFVCGSPVQVMRAVHMKMRYEICKGKADIFITNFCSGHKQIAEKLDYLGIFDHVYEADISAIKRHMVFHLIYGNTLLAQTIRGQNYDKMFTFNIEGEVAQAIFAHNRDNPEFEHHCVEDGPNIYTLYEPPVYHWYHPFKWMGIDRQAYHITKWWTSCPEFIELPQSFHTEKEKLVPIDINDREYLEKINIVFSYEENTQLEEADVLIMEESHYTDGLMIDNADFELYNEIRKKYSRKKFLVKLHPRTKINRFAETFDVMYKPDIPWELYVLNRVHNPKKLIQISIACGTMLSDRFMFGIEGKKVILAPLFYDKVRITNGVKRINENETRKYELIKNTYKNPDDFVVAYSEANLYAALDRNFSKNK